MRESTFDDHFERLLSQDHRTALLENSLTRNRERPDMIYSNTAIPKENNTNESKELLLN